MIEWIQGFDHTVLSWIVTSLRHTVLDPIVIFITSLGNAGIIWIVLSLLLLIRPKTRRCGLAMLTALLLGLLIGNFGIKNLVARSRPFVTYPEIVPLVHPGDVYSFPSGHTLSSFCAATACLCYFPKGGMACTLLAVLIGLSRLYVGVHYPSDVLGGALLGILIGLVSVWLVDRIWDRVRFDRIRR